MVTGVLHEESQFRDSLRFLLFCFLCQIIEKRRRDRINNSLLELRRLVPTAFEKQVRICSSDIYAPVEAKLAI